MSRTETEYKLSDAASQMKLALNHGDHEPTFRSCINSFISSARSVTMVMEKESAHSPELLKWYKKQTANFANDPLMKFFNDKRVRSIHKASVKLRSTTVPISDLKINGELVKSAVDDGEAESASTMQWWSFDEKCEVIGLEQPTDNVIYLCDEYFRSLKNLVAEWLYLKVNPESS